MQQDGEAFTCREGELFPGSSTERPKRPFDPQAESVVLSNQKKKKAGVKTVRTVTREVVLVSNRQQLKEDGRVRSLQFTRVMTPKETTN